jgi:hypothetical protein
MKMIIGTVFTAKSNSMEYTVHRRVESPTGVTVDFVDKNNNWFRKTPEQVLLDKLKNGDIFNVKVLNIWTPNTSLEINGETIITELKIM